MDQQAFLATVAAVIAGNLLTGLFAYFLWYGQKVERKGLSWEAMPAWVMIVGIIPLGFAALAIVAFVTPEAQAPGSSLGQAPAEVLLQPDPPALTAAP